jgi:HK97 family phage major capsid protein
VLLHSIAFVACQPAAKNQNQPFAAEGNTMPTKKDLQEKRLRLITEAQTIVQAEKVTTEDRAKFDTIMKDHDEVEQDILNIERVEKIQADLRSTKRPPRGEPGATGDGKDGPDAEKRALEARAFEKYIRFGKDALDPEERAAMREKRELTTANTGEVIPQQFLPTLIDAQKLIGNTVSIVGKKVTNNNGAPIKVAMSNDTGNTLTTVTGEGTGVTEQDPGFSGFIMSTDTVATLVKVSRQELADSYFNLDNWLKTKFGLRYYRGLEAMITAGNGSNVASIVTTATLGATAAAAAGPVYDDFTACYGSLDAAYEGNASWLMSTTTRAYLLGLKDNYGRPFFVPNPNTGTLDYILGRPIVLNQALPSAVNVSTTLTATGILYGDFAEGYLLRTDGDISILRLDERYADTLEVGFIGYARVGGAATDAGTHPIRTLVTPHV